MKMVEKYIYAVTSRLPEKQRGDIRKELEGLIEDMLEERSGQASPSAQDIEAVLLELGPPDALADSYRGKSRSMISPLMFDSYWSTVKIVLASVSIVLSVIFAIETIVQPVQILEYFVKWIVSLITVNVQAFGWVTLVFFVIDYCRPGDEELKSKSKEWKPQDLPDIPDAKKQISLCDPISGIVFIILFLVVCFYSIDLLGVYRFHDDVRTVIPFLDAAVFNRYLPFIVLAAVIGLSVEGLKILIRKRTGKLLVWTLVLRFVSTGILIAIFMDSAIWNPVFLEQLATVYMIIPGSEGFDTVSQIWQKGTANFFVIMLIFLVIDFATETYKWQQAKHSPFNE